MFDTRYLFLIMASLLFAYWKLWQYLFSPRSSSIDKLTLKRVERIKKVTNESKAHLRRERTQKLYAIIKEIPGMGLKTHTRDEYIRYIITTDKRVDGALISPEEIYTQQVLIVFGTAIVSLIGALFFKYAIFGIFLGFFLWRIPLDNMKEVYQSNNKEIVKQFGEFYDMYYCQFISKDCVKKIYDICQAFMPIANPIMRKMLDRFMIDLELDESHALNELDYRYSDNKYIHKFCSVAKVRLQGDEAAYASLIAFREELQTEKKLSLRRQLERRTHLASAVIGGMLISVFSLATLVFLGCMMAAG